MEQFESAKSVVPQAPEPYVEWGPREFRRFILAVGLLTGLLALTVFGMIAYGYAHFHNLWNGVGSLGLVSFLLLCGLMLAVAAGSLLGLVGAYRNRQHLMCIYSFITGAGLVLFLSLAIVTIVQVPKYFDPSDDSKCTKIDTFQRFQQFNEAAQNSICKGCACYFPSISNPAIYTAAGQNILETNVEQTYLSTVAAPQYSTTNATNPVNAQDCSSWDKSSYLTGHLPMSEMEEKMSCTGWCSNTTSLFFRFSNVNRGKPIGTCYLEASKYVEYYSRIGFVLAFAFAALFALSLMSTLIYLFGRSHSFTMKYGDTTAQALQQPSAHQQSAFMSGPHYGPQQTQYTPTPFLTPAAAQQTVYNIR